MIVRGRVRGSKPSYAYSIGAAGLVGPDKVDVNMIPLDVIRICSVKRRLFRAGWNGNQAVAAPVNSASIANASRNHTIARINYSNGRTCRGIGGGGRLGSRLEVRRVVGRS